jgi:hypothetical protein
MSKSDANTELGRYSAGRVPADQGNDLSALVSHYLDFLATWTTVCVVKAALIEFQLT